MKKFDFPLHVRARSICPTLRGVGVYRVSVINTSIMAFVLLAVNSYQWLLLKLVLIDSLK